MAVISVSAWARAAVRFARAGVMVRRAACRVAVKEIRPGSMPLLAAARAARARRAW